MHYFFYKLTSPRPTFPADMTPEEGKLMRQHVAYWSARMAEGKMVVFGPVVQPEGTFGIGIIRLEDPSEAPSLAASDPVILASVGFQAEVYPMPRAVVVGAQSVSA